MAIIKMINAKSGKPYGLKAVLDYIQNPEKTQQGILVHAKDCMLETAYQQMLLTKLNFAKTTGRQYIHFIQSFPVDESVTPELVHQVGKELLQHIPGYQGVIATHTDRQHIHNHIVLNSVHLETGQKWQMSKEKLYKLRKISDQLCKKYHLPVLTGERKGWRSYGEHKGNSWKKALAEDLVECLHQSTNKEEWFHHLAQKGITADYNGKTLLFTTPDGMKCSNAQLMSYGNFSIKNLKCHFIFNENTYNKYRCEPPFLQPAFYARALLFPKQDADTLEQQYYANALPSLEGQALKEWILKKKGSSTVDNRKTHIPKAQPSVLPDLVFLLEEIRARKQAEQQDWDDEEMEI